MKKAWSVILAIVFGAILLGAVCIGVGYITGADISRITSVIEGSPVYAYVQMLIAYWNEAVATASDYASTIPLF